MNACRVPSFMILLRKEFFLVSLHFAMFWGFFLAQKPTWWLTLTNSVCFLQPGVSVAGQITPDHLAFGQNADEDGDGDGWDDNGHQELPVVRAVVAHRRRQSVCKREKYDLRSWSDPCSIINLDCWFLCCVVLWIEYQNWRWKNNSQIEIIMVYFSTCDALPFCVAFDIGVNPVAFTVVSILLFVQTLAGCVFTCVD